MAVEVGDDLANDVDSDALTPQRPDLWIDGPGRPGELGHRGRTVDPSRHQLRIAGEETQQVDVFENADEFAVLRNRNPLLVMLRHLEQRGRDKIAWSDAYDRAPRERPDRAFDGEPIENRRVQEIRAGHDAGFGAFLDQEGVTVGGLHPGAGVGDCLLSIHEHRGMKEKVATRAPSNGEKRAASSSCEAAPSLSAMSR